MGTAGCLEDLVDLESSVLEFSGFELLVNDNSDLEVDRVGDRSFGFGFLWDISRNRLCRNCRLLAKAEYRSLNDPLSISFVLRLFNLLPHV